MDAILGKCRPHSIQTASCYLLSVIFLSLFLMVCSISYAEEVSQSSTDEAALEQIAPYPDELKTITLKMMIVNPSQKHKQTYPMKAYLPEEVRPEYILDKEDMQVEYDEEKGSYYVMQDLELEPGEAMVKTVTLRDVWELEESELKALSEEAHDLLNSLVGTKYEEQGKLLLSNVEVLLIQIFESQHDDTLTPEEHISSYRENKTKKDDIEMDLMALRRFVVTAGVDPGVSFMKGGKGKSGGALGLPGMVTNWEQGDQALEDEGAKKGSGSGKGQIPAWMLWRIIFAVLFFIGGLTMIFFVVWAHQMSTTKKRKQMNLDERLQGKSGDVGKADGSVEQIKLGDFIKTDDEIKPDDGKQAS